MGITEPKNAVGAAPGGSCLITPGFSRDQHLSVNTAGKAKLVYGCKEPLYLSRGAFGAVPA